MDSRFAESWVNRDDHVVFGRRLHDYCLYDAFFLAIDENPLHLRHRDVTRADLFMAAYICSTPPARLLKGCRPSPLATHWWRWRMRRRSLVLEVKRFEAYVSDFDARPVFWGGGGGEPLKAPWVLSIATLLEAHTNATESQIMTMPVGKALWKAAAIAEQNGMTKDDIMSSEEEAAMKEMGMNLDG